MQERGSPLKISLCILLFVCLIDFAAIAGCTGRPETPRTPTPVPEETEATAPTYTIFLPAGPQPAFSATATVPEKHFRSDQSCYWIVTGTVTNTGDAPKRNVVIRFMLIDDADDMIRSTETILIPLFQAGEEKIFTTGPLPGDCDREYRAEIAVTHDVP